MNLAQVNVIPEATIRSISERAHTETRKSRQTLPSEVALLAGKCLERRSFHRWADSHLQSLANWLPGENRAKGHSRLVLC